LLLLLAASSFVILRAAGCPEQVFALAGIQTTWCRAGLAIQTPLRLKSDAEANHLRSASPLMRAKALADWHQRECAFANGWFKTEPTHFGVGRFQIGPTSVTIIRWWVLAILFAAPGLALIVVRRRRLDAAPTQLASVALPTAAATTAPPPTAAP